MSDNRREATLGKLDIYHCYIAYVIANSSNIYLW
jgi:hypothetical protein